MADQVKGPRSPIRLELFLTVPADGKRGAQRMNASPLAVPHFRGGASPFTSGLKRELG